MEELLRILVVAAFQHVQRYIGIKRLWLASGLVQFVGDGGRCLASDI